MLINDDSDIHGPVLVMDLEWVGDTNVPYLTHVYDMACQNIATGDMYSGRMAAMASGVAVPGTADPASFYSAWVDWLSEQKGDDEAVYIIAHNGIRYDAPVLLHGMRKYGVPVPGYIKIMDSLHHLRYHMRHLDTKPLGYDIDSLCVYCGVPADPDNRHTAAYDVQLLCEILLALNTTCGLPIISGVAHGLDSLSTMLVHGIGPVVYCSLPTTSLQMMCMDIIREYGNLSSRSCMCYLEACGLKERVPLCRLDVIAENISVAAQRHVQYLEQGVSLR